ncbi:MAG: transporter [Thiobacillus sp.]|nr:transporter [Thiobacillus sp.]
MVTLLATLAANPAAADEYEVDLALQLANPVAALISVPLQLNYESDIGPIDEGDRWFLNVQPVVPFDLNPRWNLISRTILPVVSQQDIFPGAGSQTGLGDTVQSFFLSPKAPTAGGWIWGAGPVLLLPTGTDDLLTRDKGGAGPTVVFLKQANGWTRGVLANHLWSFAGSSNRDDVNASFVQPFLTYTTPTSLSYSLSSETTYDWDREEWAVPVNFSVSRVTRVGTQLLSVGGGVRYWVNDTANGPEGFGFRLNVTLLFPR